MLNAIPLNYKMNDIMHTLLLAGNKFMPEMHLRKTGLTYSACGPFTKNKERIRKFKATGDSGCIYKNELNKACLQHDMVYGDFKDLVNKVLKNKALNIAKVPTYDGYQRGLTSTV